MWKYATPRRVSFYNLSCIQAFSHAFVLLSSTASYPSVIVFTLIFIQFVFTGFCAFVLFYIQVVIISIYLIFRDYWCDYKPKPEGSGTVNCTVYCKIRALKARIITTERYPARTTWVYSSVPQLLPCELKHVSAASTEAKKHHHGSCFLYKSTAAFFGVFIK